MSLASRKETPSGQNDGSHQTSSTRVVGRNTFPTVDNCFVTTAKDKAQAKKDCASRQEKLEELRNDLKTAFEEYAHDKTMKYQPHTLEDELTVYVTKLIGQVKTKGWKTESMKETQEQQKSRLNQVNAWLDKLKVQIEKETFDPTEIKSNTFPEMKEIHAKICDVCMKLKTRQNERTSAEKGQTEENAQMEESLTLMQRSMENIKSTLLSNPAIFKMPGRQSEKRVDDFDKKLRVPLSLVLDIEDIVTESSKRDTLSHLNDTSKALQAKVSSQEHELCDLKKTVKDLRFELQSKYEVLAKKEEKIYFLTSQADKIEKEKEDLLIRLSKLTGARLTDNNSNIADLSDTNRPTKLAEAFKELYDNEWTEAYEALEKAEKQEDVALKCLHDIIVGVYQECGKYAERQNFIVRTILVCPTKELRVTDSDEIESGKRNKFSELTAEQSKGVSELRKQTIVECTEDITEYFKSKFKAWFRIDAVGKYTKCCIRLCWLMQIQSPPVHLDTETQPGAVFDRNKYKEYTRSGKKVDYVVWPYLSLSKSDTQAVLSKGVAQGK